MNNFFCAANSNCIFLRFIFYSFYLKKIFLQWIADLIGAKLSGNINAAATGINEIHKVENGDLVFVDHPKYYDKCINSDATFIIINKETDVPEGKALLIVDNPFE